MLPTRTPWAATALRAHLRPALLSLQQCPGGIHFLGALGLQFSVFRERWTANSFPWGHFLLGTPSSPTPHTYKHIRAHTLVHAHTDSPTFALVLGLYFQGQVLLPEPRFSPVLQALWNRAVLCSHSTWLKNVRNVELYFPPPSFPAFSFLTLLLEKWLTGEVFLPQFSPSVLLRLGGGPCRARVSSWGVCGSVRKQPSLPFPSSVLSCATFPTETGRRGKLFH